ncbi:FkbM family methyltransferase [Lewinella sp. IMCC34191]|uniref:FkbM family methyltransferase n=1 Tax=Lewinella sp. IMCC34191 TaxID=2259172 RepID=UPI000E2446E7|nr:FkbM family methyltransferase [Lewinella sp. IMCC34191]
MQEEQLWESLDALRRRAGGSRTDRLRFRPLPYVGSQAYLRLVYPLFRRALRCRARTFFGTRLELLLPSGTDIYITGGKTHDSEIRLAAFLLRHLRTGDCFVDVGAHYGYFTQLASVLVGSRGRVAAFEASPETFGVLQRNVATFDQTCCQHAAVSDRQGTITFYTFPNLFAEYNSTTVAEHAGASWFSRNPPTETEVPCHPLDDLLELDGEKRVLVKIDVEGGEAAVIRGSSRILAHPQAVFVMEYVNRQRGNTAHRQAEAMFRQEGYTPFSIDGQGNLTPVTDIEDALREQGIDSDNIAFARAGNFGQGGGTR